MKGTLQRKGEKRVYVLTILLTAILCIALLIPAFADQGTANADNKTLTITKSVTGESGDKNKKFNFTIKYGNTYHETIYSMEPAGGIPIAHNGKVYFMSGTCRSIFFEIPNCEDIDLSKLPTAQEILVDRTWYEYENNLELRQYYYEKGIYYNRFYESPPNDRREGLDVLDYQNIYRSLTTKDFSNAIFFYYDWSSEKLIEYTHDDISNITPTDYQEEIGRYLAIEYDIVLEDTQEFALSDGEMFSIDLPKGTEYEITEEDTDYNTTIIDGSGQIQDGTTVSGTVKADTYIEYINNLEAESTSEEPSSEEPTSEEPSSPEPSSEETNSTEPSSEPTSSQEPSSEPTSPEESSSEETSSDEPSSVEPSSEELSSDEPSSEEPSSVEPSSEVPSSEEEQSTEPSAEDSSGEIPPSETSSQEETTPQQATDTAPTPTISKSVDKAEVRVGEEVLYTVTITTDEPLKNAVVTEYLPTGMSLSGDITIHPPYDDAVIMMKSAAALNQDGTEYRSGPHYIIGIAHLDQPLTLTCRMRADNAGEHVNIAELSADNLSSPASASARVVVKEPENTADDETTENKTTQEEITTAKTKETTPKEPQNISNTKQGQTTDGSKAPKTGDSANIYLWITLMVLMAVGFVSTLVISRKNKD